MFCGKRQGVFKICQGGFLFFLLNRCWAFLFPFVRTKEKETKRKSAVCTFLPTLLLFSTKQKELASLKQLFVFIPPTLTAHIK